ncbi:MAG: hypothetical protein INQ03_24180 [Candidatus Heimdallarchaeota archaeon]|nr:hypothetical protein [Candidatus Heimdallarchaeota archaeon]
MNRKSIIFLFITAILLFSPYSSVLALDVANTNFATGDKFLFSSNRISERVDENAMQFSNPDNDSMIYRYEGQYNEFYVDLEGDFGISLIKSSANIPFENFYKPGDPEFDHLMIMDGSDMVAQPGSEEYWERYFLDMGGSNTWENDSGSNDLSGQHFGDDNDGGDEDIMPVVSNSTYLLLFPEMVDETIWADWGNNEDCGPEGCGNNPLQDVIPYGFDVPLVSRDVYDDTFWYVINDVNQSLNVRSVDSAFYTMLTNTTYRDIKFGDQNDPNAPMVNMTVDWTVTVDFYSSFIFDKANGMLVDMYQYRSIDVDVELYHNNFTMPEQPPVMGLDEDGGGPTSFDIYMYFSTSAMEEEYNTVSEASAFYGNSRPTSTGTNNRGFSEGDALVFFMEQGGWNNMHRTTHGESNNSWNYDEHQNRWNNRHTEGEIVFDIFRTQPDSWEAVMFFYGMGNYEGEEYMERWENGMYQWDQTWDWNESRDDVMFQIIQFMSTEGMDLQYFHDDHMWIDGLNYDDRLRFLDQYREIPKNTTMQTVSDHMDFEGEEVFAINGFDVTWMNVTAYTQTYAFSTEQTINIWMSDYGMDFEVPVDVYLFAEAWQTWYYDDATGAFIAMDQGSYFYADLSIEYTIERGWWENHEGIDYYYAEEIFSNSSIMMEGGTHWFMLLQEHPSLYQSAYPDDPVDHTPVTTDPTTTSDPSTTSEEPTTTTEEPTTTTDENDTAPETPQLPIPISLGPVVFSLSVIAIYARRRK